MSMMVIPDRRTPLELLRAAIAVPLYYAEKSIFAVLKVGPKRTGMRHHPQTFERFPATLDRGILLNPKPLNP